MKELCSVTVFLWQAHFLKVMKWKMTSVGKASAEDLIGIEITSSDLSASSATVKVSHLWQCSVCM